MRRTLRRTPVPSPRTARPKVPGPQGQGHLPLPQGLQDPDHLIGAPGGDTAFLAKGWGLESSERAKR